MHKKRIGIVGFGGIARYNHYLAGYKQIPNLAEVTAVCDIDNKALKDAKEIIGISDDRLFKNYHALIDSGLCDAIDICTPNYLHCEIADAAMDKGLPFSVEKPVGMNLKETNEIFRKAEKLNIPTFVCFSWRYRPYTRFVRDIIRSGEIGRLYHIYIDCIKDSALWEGRRMEWRFEAEKAGTGVIGDLASHMIDMVHYWGEEITEVFARKGIVVKERQALDSDTILPVTTDDWCNVNAMTNSGASVTMNISRCATTVSDLISLEAIGEKGRIKFTFTPEGQDIVICSGDIDIKGKGTHHLTPPDDYMVKRTFDVNVFERYTSTQSSAFIEVLNGERSEHTSCLDDGIKCQKVMEAIDMSCKENINIKIKP